MRRVYCLAIIIELMSVSLAWASGGKMAMMPGMTMPSIAPSMVGAHQRIPWVRAQSFLASSLHEGVRRGHSLYFPGQHVALTIVANAPHHPDMSFEAAGLTNPTIVMNKGVQVTLSLLNMDYGAGMAHGIVITTTKPPYPAITNGVLRGIIAQTGLMPARTGPNRHQALYAVTTTRFTIKKTGVYYYVCPAPGHAAAFHMYGTLRVR